MTRPDSFSTKISTESPTIEHDGGASTGARGPGSAGAKVAPTDVAAVQTLLDRLLVGRPALAAYVHRVRTAPAGRPRGVPRDRRFRPTIDEIIDGLVIDNALIPEEVGAYLAPRSRVVTVMEALPECYACGRQARFDGRGWFTGTWAWWCRSCFVELAGGIVGGSGGVYLLRPDEVPDEAREVCDALAAERHLQAAS